MYVSAGSRCEPAVPGRATAGRCSSPRPERGAVARLLCRFGPGIGVDAWLGLHVLRHTCATLARTAGVPLEDIQDQLGHADGRAVRRYDHGGIRLDRAPAYALIEYHAVV
ncbi:tyrosine-type recombinase/integrase [Dactylosporangium sp. NPDC005555]|uniref:tyrosine-type recombinase/integrase n=1 Tax=Dactylosporangium sp. NPDC005555 TaxID=3154889 RepID=UPI0033BDEE52